MFPIYLWSSHDPGAARPQGCGDYGRSCASLRSRHWHVRVLHRSIRMYSIAAVMACSARLIA